MTDIQQLRNTASAFFNASAGFTAATVFTLGCAAVDLAQKDPEHASLNILLSSIFAAGTVRLLAFANSKNSRANALETADRIKPLQLS